MELLKTVKRRTFWSELVYYVLNIGLTAALLVIAQAFQTPFPALALVVLSKWRIIAVRPRFWWANIQANLVDLTVGIGVVGLMYLPTSVFYFRVALAILYAIWLVVIKPMSKRWQVAMQSLIAIFVGVTALMVVSYEWPVSVVVILMFLIGYSSARHFLHSYDEEQTVLLSAIWGLVFAELGWLSYYWTYSYGKSLFGGVSQVTIILLLFSLVASKAYQSYNKHKAIRFSDISAPVILTIGIILVMLVFLNSVVI